MKKKTKNPNQTRKTFRLKSGVETSVSEDKKTAHKHLLELCGLKDSIWKCFMVNGFIELC